MYLYERIFRTIRGWFRPFLPRNFSLDVDTLYTLKRIAKEERRTPEEVADRVLNDALQDIEFQQENQRRWQRLSPREKDVAALICLHYTTRQIAAFLGISPETVKTHAEHILKKFDVPNREVLRETLYGWDFSEWEP